MYFANDILTDQPMWIVCIASCQSFSWSVDDIIVRVHKNQSESLFTPKNQATRVYVSLWHADDWATRGGLVKTDWSQAPFTASYWNFSGKDCVSTSGTSSCPSNSPSSSNREWTEREIDLDHTNITWVQNNYMVYNYCSDVNRFSQGLPAEMQNGVVQHYCVYYV